MTTISDLAALAKNQVVAAGAEGITPAQLKLDMETELGYRLDEHQFIKLIGAAIPAIAPVLTLVPGGTVWVLYSNHHYQNLLREDTPQ